MYTMPFTALEPPRVLPRTQISDLFALPGSGSVGEEPRVLRIGQQLAETLRNANERIHVVGTRLDEQHTMARVLRKAIRENAAGGTGTHDDVVEVGQVIPQPWMRQRAALRSIALINSENSSVRCCGNTSGAEL